MMKPRLTLIALAALLALAVGTEQLRAQAPGTTTLPTFRPGAGLPGAQAPVVQVHHHHYYQPYGGYPPGATMATRYAPHMAYQYGFQPGLGTFYLPTRVDWGGLGFYGFLDANSPHEGLCVSRVVPGSPAQRMGLLVGDYIVKINGTKIDSYRKLREALAAAQAKDDVSTFDVWHLLTRRETTLRANFSGEEAGAARKLRKDEKLRRVPGDPDPE